MMLPHAIALLIGYTANTLQVVAFFMRVPVRLRQVAIFSNMFFLVFGTEFHLWGMLISNLILFPLNIWRLRELLDTRRAVRAAMATTDLSWEWIRPFMTRRRFKTDATIFKKGDLADEIYFILDGRVRFEEIGVEIGIGTLFGEIAMFSPERRRMSTARVLDDALMLTISLEQVIELYERNPQFGVYLMRLTTGRLLEDLERSAGVRHTLPADPAAVVAEADA
ncbi:MAG: Crp/Fnr family transcriptional regulator [Candidatus Velthaea sp.]